MRARRGRKRLPAGEQAFQVLLYVIFTLLTLICVYPFYYMFLSTISSQAAVSTGKILLLPVRPSFRSYAYLLQNEGLWRAMFVSVSRVAIVALNSVVLTSYVAYMFTRLNMWHRKAWYRLCVATMYFSAGLIPTYLNMRALGLLDSYFIYIIPGCFSAYNMILVKTSMEALPASLEESARIDGAGPLVCWARIALPLSRPILATIALFVVEETWNDYYTTLVYINARNDLYTLQYLLYQRLQQSGGNSAHARTMTMVIAAPLIFVYPFIQKYFVKGIMLGALKG